MVDLHFRVRDTGIGIPREKQSAIFDLFTQVDSSTKRRYGGTGLTIATRLVQLMQCKIWMEGEPGSGTIFSLHGAILTRNLTFRDSLTRSGPAAQATSVGRRR